MNNPIIGRQVFQDSSKKSSIVIDPNSIEGWFSVCPTTTGQKMFEIGTTIGPPKVVLRMGGAGHGSTLRIYDLKDRQVLYFDSDHAALYLGEKGSDGDLIIKNAAGKEVIKLDGASGDIILENADCAEDFDISGSDSLEPGTVMVVDSETRLSACDHPYDRRVAGVIAGAGGYKPGIVLDRQRQAGHRMPISLVGKTYCKVDAHFGGVDVGDLLTTSATPGHAMKAQDRERSFGAVLGKALGSVREGQGLIPILVALQ